MVKPAEILCKVTFCAAVYEDSSKPSMARVAAMVQPESMITGKPSEVKKADAMLSDL